MSEQNTKIPRRKALQAVGAITTLSGFATTTTAGSSSTRKIDYLIETDGTVRTKEVPNDW